MSVNLIKLLLAVCSLLSTLLVLEFLVLNQSPALKKIDPIKQTQATKLQLPEISLTEKTVDGYLDMVDKPLFIKGRKPVNEDKLPSNKEISTPIRNLTLVGIYSLGNQKIALFRPRNTRQPHLKKSAGEKLSGWIIKTIKSDQVILQQGGKQQIIKLRKPKPQRLNKSPLRPKPKPARPVNPFIRQTTLPKS